MPVALSAQIKGTLDDLQADQIIAPVTRPTEWISSLVVAHKKDTKKLRICQDPKDLNRAIQREHYSLPTIEIMSTRLYGAKVFSIFDVRSGFWHVKLDDPSSYLITFNMLIGTGRNDYPSAFAQRLRYFRKKSARTHRRADRS